MVRIALGLAATLALGWAVPARAQKGRPALFVLVIGVNGSIDKDLKELSYADDDAARTFDLFRALGARTYLLASLDEDTRGLHPQAAAEARPAKETSLADAVRSLANDIAQARQRSVESAFYLFYAGHGKEHDHRGFLALEDGWLTANRILEEVVEPLHADQVHLVIDACHSYWLAYGRGPGGKRTKIRGFSRMGALASRKEIGLLLSGAKGRENHEWEAFQAGVFSHLLRSGLHGAADADRDGLVSYREIASFVDRAKRAIPNKRFRPRVIARAPSRSETLLDLRDRLQRRIEINGALLHGHYLLEDALGIRVLDFHNSPRQQVRLLRLDGRGVLFLREARGEKEFTLPLTQGVIRVASLQPGTYSARQRGAAGHAFEHLFELPFDMDVVEHYEPPDPIDLAGEQPDPGPSWARYGGWGAMGLAAASAVAGAAFGLSARSLRHGAGPDVSQQDLARLNEQIEGRNDAALGLCGVAAGAAATGLLLLLWPDALPPSANALPQGALRATLGRGLFTLGLPF